jgi:hypothetical protein
MKSVGRNGSLALPIVIKVMVWCFCDWVTQGNDTLIFFIFCWAH